ncbi:PREDICTED: lysozyme D-like [Nicrophorus vespilloides]|uniref:lysozyme n=1 Tax=Nicrophorus vespilloides TaxID=110193 RepID=A0ABM1M7V7_NICVS|nr:PREDICTED: lysozyme D-like [Nicrophorus vespilloides]
MNAIILSLALATALVCDGRILSPSQFQKELRRNNVPEWMIPTWTCIAEHESHFDTAAWNRQSGDHGILQISELYWCYPPGKGCGVNCNALRNDDITDDIKCAMHVYKETSKMKKNGFSAWVTYKYCH